MPSSHLRHFPSLVLRGDKMWIPLLERLSEPYHPPDLEKLFTLYLPLTLMRSFAPSYPAGVLSINRWGLYKNPFVMWFSSSSTCGPTNAPDENTKHLINRWNRRVGHADCKHLDKFSTSCIVIKVDVRFLMSPVLSTMRSIIKLLIK